MSAPLPEILLQPEGTAPKLARTRRARGWVQT